MNKQYISMRWLLLAFTVWVTAHLTGCEQAVKTVPSVPAETVTVQPPSVCEVFAESVISGTQISAASLIASNNELPEYCRIEGKIQPDIRVHPWVMPVGLHFVPIRTLP